MLADQFFYRGQIAQRFKCGIVKKLLPIALTASNSLAQIIYGLIIMLQSGMGASQLVEGVGVVWINGKRLLAQVDGPLSIVLLQNNVRLISQRFDVFGING